MISRFLRPLCLCGAVFLGFVIGPVLRAQVTTNEWTGAVDSDYLKAGNWAGGVVPGATTDLQLSSTPTNRVINLTNPGAADFRQDVYAMQTAVNYGYTLNLSGSATGRLIYNIVGRGTHPYTTAATGTATGAGFRNALYINMSNTTISFVGSSTLAMAATSGLTYGWFNMTNGSIIDASGMTSASGRNTVGIGFLNMAPGTSVNLGAYVGFIGGLQGAADVETWAGRIYGTATGSTIKYGTGITRVTSTGVVDLPGGLTLRNGGLQYLVDGVHNGPVGTYSGQATALGGTGVINGAVSIYGGSTIAPAGRVATGNLTVNGTLNLFGAASFELFSPAQFDHLQVNGVLNLIPTGTPTPPSTGQVTIGLGENFPLEASTYRVMNFTGGMLGNIARITVPSSAGLKGSYYVGPDYIDIIFTQALFGEDPNLTNKYHDVAVAIDDALSKRTVPASLRDYMNRETSILLTKEVLDQLSPSCYYSWYPSAVTRTNSTISMIKDRLDQKGERVEGAMDAYMVIKRQESSIDVTDLADYSNYDTMTTLGGVDMLVAPGFTLGGEFEYASTQNDLNQAQNTGNTDSATVAFYGQIRRGSFEVQAVGFGGFDKYEGQRNVVRTGLAAWAKADTKGDRLGGSISTSYTKKFKWCEVTPSIGGYVLNWRVKGFTETEAAEANLVLKDQQEIDYAAYVGVRIAQTFSTKRGTLRPFVNVSQQRDFSGETRKIRAELFGSEFATKVPAIQKNGLRIDTGLDWSLTNKLSAQIRYATEAGGIADESLSLSGGLNYAF